MFLTNSTVGNVTIQTLRGNNVWCSQPLWCSRRWQTRFQKVLTCMQSTFLNESSIMSIFIRSEFSNKSWLLNYCIYLMQNRMWRRTRARHGSCIGADPNRNWNYKWGGNDWQGCTGTDILTSGRNRNWSELDPTQQNILSLQYNRVEKCFCV